MEDYSGLGGDGVQGGALNPKTSSPEPRDSGAGGLQTERGEYGILRSNGRFSNWGCLETSKDI